MKRLECYILLILFIILPLTISAKEISSELGMRIEINEDTEYIGPDYKYYFNANFAGEGFVLSDFENGIEFYALAEYIGFIAGIPENFSYYCGAGLHAGSWKGYDDPFVAGVDGIIGMQYRFDKIPVTLALDWHPLFNIFTDKDERFWLQKFGISVRYSF